MTSTAPDYDERYLEYFELFNERYFYDCHEVLEDLWLDNDGDSRKFYQGLIHLATAYQHLFRRNRAGCEARFRTALKYLEPYGEYYEGLDLMKVRVNVALWLGRMTTAPGPATYRDADVPVLELK